jgi:hypothetical protein
MEGDLRQLWQQTKQRLKRQLQDAHSVYKQPQQQCAGGSTVARASASELEHLYGSNGLFRVSRLLSMRWWYFCMLSHQQQHARVCPSLLLLHGQQFMPLACCTGCKQRQALHRPLDCFHLLPSPCLRPA